MVRPTKRFNPKTLPDADERDALKEKKTVKRWLASLVPGSHAKVLNVLFRFLKWRRGQGMESDPDKLVAEVLDGNGRVRSDHLQAAFDWLTMDPEVTKWTSPESRRAYLTAIKSFYSKNMADLPSKGLDIHDESADVEVREEASAREFLEFVRRVLADGHLSARDRSVVLTKTQGLMDNRVLCDVFNVVAFPQLVKHFGTKDFRKWDETKVPVKVDLVRPKTRKPTQYYTYLDHDAIKALKEWLAIRERFYGPIRIHPAKPGKVAKSDPIYCMKFSGEVRPLRATYVSTLFNRFGKRAGVNIPVKDGIPQDKAAKRRYPFRGHEVRDTAVTLARSVGVPSEVVNFFCGHSIDRLGYDKSPWSDPEHFKAMYSKLAPYLNVVSGSLTRLKVQYDQRLVGELGARDAQISDLQSELRRLREGMEGIAARMERDAAEREALTKSSP